MSMTDKRAAEIIRTFFSWTRLARGNGKSGLTLEWTEALLKAVAALEKKEPRPIFIKGSIFKRRYCPACHERVKKGGRFCHACGQAIRGRYISDYLPSFSTPPPPPRSYGTSAGIVVFDELHDWKK